MEGDDYGRVGMSVVEGVEGCVMGRGEGEFSGGMRVEREECRGGCLQEGRGSKSKEDECED